MKLHLGCGQKYLKGYINIDFPPAKHTVQKKSVADKFADITKLRYKADSIDEIRLHHVFEHFPRPTAIGLLVSWRSWLKLNGVLHIEVPDFTRTALAILNPLSGRRAKSVAFRHIFGSHEADWAIHCEGWSSKRLSRLLKLLKFDIVKINRISWKKTYNFEIKACKNKNLLSEKKASKLAKQWLEKYLVDKTETKLLKVWLNIYKNQVKRSWSYD